MSESPHIDRAWRALLEKTNSEFWVGIGRTTPWDDEETPPAVDLDAVDIEEPIVYVQATQTHLCKVVTTGEDVIVAGVKYAFVADEDALTEIAEFIYMVGEFTGTVGGQPHADFRQWGVLRNLVPAAGHETDTWLAPANVEDPGILAQLENHVKATYDGNWSITVPIVIEMT